MNVKDLQEQLFIDNPAELLCELGATDVNRTRVDASSNAIKKFSQHSQLVGFINDPAYQVYAYVEGEWYLLPDSIRNSPMLAPTVLSLLLSGVVFYYNSSRKAASKASAEQHLADLGATPYSYSWVMGLEDIDELIALNVMLSRDTRGKQDHAFIVYDEVTYILPVGIDFSRREECRALLKELCKNYSCTLKVQDSSARRG